MRFYQSYATLSQVFVFPLRLFFFRFYLYYSFFNSKKKKLESDTKSKPVLEFEFPSVLFATLILSLVWFGLIRYLKI